MWVKGKCGSGKMWVKGKCGSEKIRIPAYFTRCEILIQTPHLNSFRKILFSTNNKDNRLMCGAFGIDLYSGIFYVVRNINTETSLKLLFNINNKDNRLTCGAFGTENTEVTSKT